MKAVVAAHDALRDVLTLSVATKEGPEGTKSRSRLPKELLQTCIRPVLLNLRDYTRLSVSLLRGLSRLLSLLSSWFNKTLGEKLLDHLQKWTDPGRIKSQKIWAEGEEPQVAAAIVDLFFLLPHASHFVEPLVKTVIKLEACLHAFKSSCVSSPYRKPLARYLNKHCQHTMSFFFQRLRSPLYTEIFQDIIKLEESQALREYLSGKQCSTSILNVCFERPLAIIRSEKTSSGSSSAGMASPKASSGMTTAELFAIHGIKQEQSPQDQKEALLRKELEGKKAKLQILQQEFSRTKESVKAKASAATATSSAEGQVALEESKRQHKTAKAAYDKAAKDFNETKQRYAAEMARANAQKNANKGDAGATRPMNIESLELQHQGFRIVDTLMANDENYLRDHNDVLRAFRWLWRSKGRSLRLQYEESVAPRYHGESKMLASFLVNYSRNFPNDVDVLFELIRIFLQSTTNDFSFVKTFLMDAVSDKLSVDQKKHIIQRFFALLAGESTEETKTLSIQLVVLPMLRATFEKASPEKVSTKRVKQPDERPDSDDSKTPGYAEKEISGVDAVVVRKFVKEVLFKEGKPIVCGDRLRVELLRISNLLLEHVPDLLEEFRRDMVKFCWNLLKSDDTSCKNWAYLVVSRFISVFETPVKIIHQVYIALLRAHQQEGKDLVRAALELLVPALPKRLQEEDLRKVIEYTNRIMFEEGNSIPQLAHIWHTIVHNSEVFYPRRHQFVRYMINSLNRLGLPPNCPPENRALSVSIVELVMKWDDLQSSTDASVATPEEAVGGAKRKAGDAQETEAEAGVDRPDKKRKLTSGAVSAASKSSDESIFVLDQSTVR
jgi:transformation/transcription domain-associated protein